MSEGACVGEDGDDSESRTVYVVNPGSEKKAIVIDDTTDDTNSDSGTICVESDSGTICVESGDNMDTSNEKADTSDDAGTSDNCAKNDVKSAVESHATFKRKRIHMGAVECFDLTHSENGKLPLSCPSIVDQKKDPNRGLHPVVRHKRRKCEINDDGASGFVSENSFGNLNSSQGFVKASRMYDISSSQNVSMDNSAGTSYPKGKPFGNVKRQKQIRNQGNLSKFVTVQKKETQTSSNPASTFSSSYKQSFLETSPSKLDRSNVKSSPRSLMYSPIKKLDDSSSIYISSDNSTSPISSQGSCNSQKVDMPQNSVIKQLFAAQKTIDLKSKKTPSQIAAKAKTSQSHPAQIKELEKIKEEAAKYFDDDGVDLNKMFDSDMEDTECQASTPGLKGSSTKTEDQYGLLGSGKYPRSESPKVNYFELLPAEVLENIFCQLPMLDLCLNSNRVCLSWNDVISNEKFVPWKKLYHQLKKDNGNSRKHVRDLMVKHQMTAPSNYLISLIRYMRDFKRVTPENLLSCLSAHKKYTWANLLISERLPECLKHEKPNPWCMVAVLVIMSHSVYDIQEIIRCLSVSSSQCTSMDILEALYCIATFLYAFKMARSQDVWNGMHYRLFYALYLYENASSACSADLAPVTSSSTGQQSLIKYSSGTDSVRLTHEQLRIVKHQTRADEVIKIVAFAGTGKTTTLVRYTQLRPDKQFLLVVYNKSVRDYAKTKFPRNVECRTGHSLAFRDFGRRYGHKLFGIKVYSLTQALPSRKGDNLFIRAKIVLSTLENYFSSADREISTSHVPDSRINDRTGFAEQIDPAAKNRYVQDAEFIWERMKDPRNKKVGMAHDGYLKLFQLSRPSLRRFDCILIDEAQDLTPAITDILLQQPQGKILVGDPHQQIYSFRGAVNAMNTIHAHTIFYLTQSFRFGPEIAHVAATCLEVLKKEKSKTLVGSGKQCTILGKAVGQIAIISRCNFTVFSEAVKKCCYSKDPCKVAFVGGTTNFGFDMLLDMYGLMLSPEERRKENIEIQHKLIKIFKNFGDMENFATKSMDNELLGKIRIVKTYGHMLPMHIRTIQDKCVSDERRADYVFSTAHKSKGLEFSTVRVTDDFLPDNQPTMNIDFDAEGLHVNVSPPRPFRDVATDEENLLYVAVTRAKNSLQMSPTLVRVLKQGGENFRYPVLSADLTAASTQFKCAETDADFAPQCLTLQRQSVTLGNGTVMPAELYSPAFLSEDFASFSSLLGPLPSSSDKKKSKES